MPFLAHTARIRHIAKISNWILEHHRVWGSMFIRVVCPALSLFFNFSCSDTPPGLLKNPCPTTTCFQPVNSVGVACVCRSDTSASLWMSESVSITFWIDWTGSASDFLFWNLFFYLLYLKLGLGVFKIISSCMFLQFNNNFLPGNSTARNKFWTISALAIHFPWFLNTHVGSIMCQCLVIFQKSICCQCKLYPLVLLTKIIYMGEHIIQHFTQTNAEVRHMIPQQTILKYHQIIFAC